MRYPDCDIRVLFVCAAKPGGNEARIRFLDRRSVARGERCIFKNEPCLKQGRRGCEYVTARLDIELYVVAVSFEYRYVCVVFYVIAVDPYLRILRRRNDNLRGRVWRDSDLQFQSAGSPAPGGFDPAVDRVVLGIRGIQRTARRRSNQDSLVPREQGPDSRDAFVHPLPDRAIGVMIERIHGRIAKPVFMAVTVPAFPHRRRPLVDRVQPRRVGFLEQQRVHEVDFAVPAQYRCQQGCAQKSCAQVIIRRSDGLQQMRYGLVDQVFGNQVEPQCKQVASLRLSRCGQSPVGIEEPLREI